MFSDKVLQENQKLRKVLEEIINIDLFATNISEIANEALYGKKDGSLACGWCDSVVTEYTNSHQFDFAPGEKMCRSCWEHDRESYLGVYGEDIGEFVNKNK